MEQWPEYWTGHHFSFQLFHFHVTTTGKLQNDHVLQDNTCGTGVNLGVSDASHPILQASCLHTRVSSLQAVWFGTSHRAGITVPRDSNRRSYVTTMATCHTLSNLPTCELKGMKGDKSSCAVNYGHLYISLWCCAGCVHLPQFMYYKRMSQAAVLIQSQFRSYYAQKRFRRSREAATIIQNRYRAYKEHERYKRSRSAAVIIQQRFRSVTFFCSLIMSAFTCTSCYYLESPQQQRGVCIALLFGLFVCLFVWLKKLWSLDGFGPVFRINSFWNKDKMIRFWALKPGEWNFGGVWPYHLSYCFCLF